jgi:hypothetical protein
MKSLIRILIASLVLIISLSSCNNLSDSDNVKETQFIVSTIKGEILGYDETDDGLVITIDDYYTDEDKRVIINKSSNAFSDNDPIKGIIDERILGAVVCVQSEHPEDLDINAVYPVTTIGLFVDEQMIMKDYSTQTFSMLEASDYIRPLGRTVMLGSSLTCDWTAAGVEFKLLCKGDISINITASNSSTSFLLKIDGVTTKNFAVTKGKGSYVVASGLEPGIHTIRIVSEEAYGANATIDSITFIGEILKADEGSAYIEVVGDSITCGSGLGIDGSDGTMAYSYIALDDINADYSICSNGGMGIAYAGSDTNIFSKVYPYQNLKRDKTLYAPTRTPDLIVVNLHTNDNWQWYSNTKNAENEKYNYDHFDTMFDDMINTFTKLYGKKIPMLFVFGCMANELYENATIRSKELIQLKYIPDGYDIKTVTLTTNRAGASSHPNKEGAEIQGAELAEFIKKNYPHFFN